MRSFAILMTVVLCLGGLLLAQPVAPAAPRSPVPPAVGWSMTKSGVSYLGVNLAEIDSNRAQSLKLKEEAGVEITRVEEDSPASKAGIRPGDVVLEYNGQRVEGMEQFGRFVRETPPGRDVKLLISRGGSPMTLTARVGARKMRYPEAEALTMIPNIRMPDVRMPDIPRSLMSWRSAFLGIEAEAIEGQFAEYFGVKQGVLVRSVMKDSTAAKAGIRAGDVILKVDDCKVQTPGDVTSALRSRTEKKPVVVILSRDRKEVTLNIDLTDERMGLLAVPPAPAASPWPPAPPVVWR